jgi:hypothetical protein
VRGPHLAVAPSGGDQLVVGAALGDLSLVQDDDLFVLSSLGYAAARLDRILFRRQRAAADASGAGQGSRP